MKRQLKSNIEEVKSGLNEYVPKQEFFDSSSQWRNEKQKPKVEKPLIYGPTKEEVEAHNPLRRIALDLMEEESLALGEKHVKDADEHHKKLRDEHYEKLKKIVSPSVEPKKPRVKSDFTLNGLQVIGIGLLFIVLAMLIKKFFLKKSLP